MDDYDWGRWCQKVLERLDTLIELQKSATQLASGAVWRLKDGNWWHTDEGWFHLVNDKWESVEKGPYD